ncbi:translation initiation factor IF-2 subunit gamma [Candidatus Woesearchaeota archaeon]|nr:MAG: translation initiation factor IF-2 subunit gamma [Candidatus Woesearchaeota archaeon]
MAKKEKEIIQPEVNIGFVGHVDHGKTTLTQQLSGKWTDTHSEELKRGITIRLGYADATFYQCTKCKDYTTTNKCMSCMSDAKFVRKVSFVDAPGHESLMATMLSGATIMDGALLLIAANEKVPQDQTREHLMALQICGIKNVIVVQNKIDVVSAEEALENYKQIKAFLANTEYKDAPVIPISALHGANIDKLIEAIEQYIPTPKRDPTKDPLFFCARSFDINKPGTKPESLVGGVLGGALVQGVLRVGDEIEIKPGRKIEKQGRVEYTPITTKIVGLKAGGGEVQELHPGGSSGIMTLLDPAIVKSDSLSGNLVGKIGTLPETRMHLKLKTHLLERFVGGEEIAPLSKGEMLMFNVNAAATVGVVQELGKDEISCPLRLPVCAQEGARVTISRRVGNRFRLIGYGEIM